MIRAFSKGKICKGMLCIGVLFIWSFPVYGATTEQATSQPSVPEKKETLTPTTPATILSPQKAEKKKAPKEGVKETKVGPPPPNAPIKHKKAKRPLRNPRNLTTGEELKPWTDK